MATYTPSYDQFLADLEKNGVKLNQYDMDIAKNDVGYGYRSMQNMIDYNNATTAEGRALAHSKQETNRAGYGFSGGVDGSQYIPLPVTPASAADNYMDSYLTPYQDTNGYDARYGSAINDVIDYGPFKYKATTDPLYQVYKQQYTRNGERAMKDTLGQVSARTGGLASSYAEQAAQQSYNNYMQELSDKIPELYQLAYNQYMDRYGMLKDNVTMLGAAGDRDYGRWTDAQGRLLDAVNYNLTKDETQYQRGQDALANDWRQREWDYNVGQDALNNDWRQREWDYGVAQDDYAKQMDAQNDARSRIEAMLMTPGFDVANIPADLISASGLTDIEIQSLALQAALAQQGRGGRGGGGVDPTPEDDLSGTLDTNAYNTLLSQLRGISGTQEAINLLRQYTPYMTESQKNVAYREAGIGADVVAAGWKNGTGITDTYLDLLTPTLPSITPSEESINTNTPQQDYEYAVKNLKQYGYDSYATTMLTPEQWVLDGRSQYDYYGDYARAYVAAHLK